MSNIKETDQGLMMNKSESIPVTATVGEVYSDPEPKTPSKKNVTHGVSTSTTQSASTSVTISTMGPPPPPSPVSKTQSPSSSCFIKSSLSLTSLPPPQRQTIQDSPCGSELAQSRAHLDRPYNSLKVII